MYVYMQLLPYSWAELPSLPTNRIFVIVIGAFIPLWILPTGFSALSAGAFCIQVGVQGAWGVVRCVPLSSLQLLINVAAHLIATIDSGTARRNITARIPRDIPWRRVSDRKHGFLCFRTDRSDGRRSAQDDYRRKWRTNQCAQLR